MIYDNNELGLNKEQLTHIYQQLLRPRLFEEKMLKLLRQGKLGKWFSGIGQEAISIGAALAMHMDEYIMPMHRNLGVFTTRNVPLARLISQFQGKANGFTKGRDRSFHFASQAYKLIGMISHLGPQLAVADGIALAHKLSKQNKCTLVFTGDGGTSEGDFHEALNVAAVWDIPVIFLIENNGYGLSTPVNEQYRCKSLADKGIGYGMEALQIDGNNVLEVYKTIKKKAEDIRQNPHPVLIECMTFRMRGHEEASGTKYIPQELFTEWAKKDPVINFEQYLIAENIISEEYRTELYKNLKKEIEEAVETAFAEPELSWNSETEIADMYFPYESAAIAPTTGNKSEKRYIDAISDGLMAGMKKHDKLVIMGQDIAEYGGAFKITNGFVEKFGKERVRNTPLCESAIVGIAFGLSINGYKAIMEMQFADFVTMGFNQIINNLAKSHYRWAHAADVVIRMPTGAGTGAGPFHSQSNEAWFVKTPGLKVVYPAFPSDAKGLLLAAIEDPNPVIFFEHKYLYRQISEEIHDDYYTLPIGKARIVKEGAGISLITYGWGVHWALALMARKPEMDIELIDLRSLLPWDSETVEQSVRKTGKALILHEDTLTCGMGAEISAHISEHCFTYLDAPVMRCASLDTAIPMNKQLEDNFLAKAKLENMLQNLIDY